MNFAEALKEQSNFGRTENGAVKHLTTKSDVLDMFAFGGAYRSRSIEDKITLFKNAYYEDKELALKCLFYLRDCRGGQGEREFFKACYTWLAKNDIKVAKYNLKFIPTYGRWDDLYCLVGTPLEKDMFAFMKEVFTVDMESKTPSLLGKWLKSENASSKESYKLAKKTREAFGLTERQYRKSLTTLRKRIKIVESLMSQGRWDEIQFDKLPSKAGFIYRNAFARNDYTKERYKKFMESKTTKVNSGTLYPYEIVNKAMNLRWYLANKEVEINTINKYWENLPDYTEGRNSNTLCVVDTSGSMTVNLPGSTSNCRDVAVSLGIYFAEKLEGEFQNMFITFSQNPHVHTFKGKTLVEKVSSIDMSDWGMNTNIEKVFDLLLNIAIKNNTKSADLPERILIISDMEFDEAVDEGSYWDSGKNNQRALLKTQTLMESMRSKWKLHGYTLPKLVYWNVNARHNNVPDLGEDVSFVSGFSPSIFKQIMSNKTGYELMLETLTAERYAQVTAEFGQAKRK